MSCWTYHVGDDDLQWSDLCSDRCTRAAVICRLHDCWVFHPVFNIWNHFNPQFLLGEIRYVWWLDHIKSILLPHKIPTESHQTQVLLVKSIFWLLQSPCWYITMSKFGKSMNSMAIFNSYVTVITRGYTDWGSTYIHINIGCKYNGIYSGSQEYQVKKNGVDFNWKIPSNHIKSH